MTEIRISAEELSRRLGMPASTIKKIRNNAGSNPTLSTLLPLAKFFSITVSQLVGDEAMPSSRIKGSYTLNTSMLNSVPLLTWEESIYWPMVSTQSDRQKITTEHFYSGQAFALLVEEDDWENLAKGTALLVDPSLALEHRDFVIVYKEGQKVPTLKQVLFDEGSIYLKPMSSAYQIVIASAEHRFLGTVVEYRKHLKDVRYEQ